MNVSFVEENVPGRT